MLFISLTSAFPLKSGVYAYFYIEKIEEGAVCSQENAPVRLKR
jgi:hypothetical protein